MKVLIHTSSKAVYTAFIRASKLCIPDVILIGEVAYIYDGLDEGTPYYVPAFVVILQPPDLKSIELPDDCG